MVVDCGEISVGERGEVDVWREIISVAMSCLWSS
jgi:hypothetical protein